MRLLTALVSLGLLVSGAVSAKELYLTVRRDFSPSEKPVVEVNYTQKAPLTFRLYKPKDMKEFIASQIDLRRAWRQPSVELNSAKYLFSGLNGTQLQLDWLRVAMSSDFREKHKEALGGATWTPLATNLSEGPKKIISGPDKFDLVQEFAFYPDEKDAKSPFDVPGFDWWFQSYGGLATKPVELSRVEPGFYLVQAVQGNLEGQVVLAVNDISAELQQTDGNALVRVARRSGAPLEGAEVELRNLQGAWVAKAKTNEDGVADLKGIKDTELVAVVRDKAGTAIIDTDFYSTTAVFPDVYLYTDRPMYRSGSKVRFRGVAREQKGGVSRMLASFGGGSPMAEVSLVNLAGGAVSEEIKVPLSKYGTFAGELELKDTDANGVYRVQARLTDASHIGEFRIKDYVKPIFFLKVATPQESLKAGSKLQATISVQRFAGGVPAGVRYSAQLVRVRAETPQWVEDSGMGETGSQVTYGWDGASVDSVSIPFPLASKDDIAFDAKGKSTLTLEVPTVLPGPPNYDYKIVLKLFAQDPDGNNASGSKNFLELKSEVIAQARMSGVYAAPDRPARLSVRAVYPSGKSYGKTRGVLKWHHTPFKQLTTTKEVPFTTDANGRFDVDVPTDKPGKLSAEVTLFDKFEKPATTETSLVVAGTNPGEPIAEVAEMSMLSRRSVYAPGETAKALILLPENWGEGGGDSGRLYITVAGKQIHEHRVEKVKGLSAWLSQPIQESYGTAVYCVVAYSDPFKGWVEKTLTLQIPPKNKSLNVEVAAANLLTKPGAEQIVTVKVSDWEKKPVQAELSLSVVDKALLTLQPEFRPSLLAFFYPLERLNLMSFFSQQFQGYGYGELVAKRFRPNFWMAAAKPEQKVMKEDDTAHWSGQVTTDAQGQAQVKFRLPANQTTWNMTAVAVDSLGRFGEGVGEFVSSMPVMLSMSYPPFLRKNDHAQIRVILASQDPQKSQSVESTLAVTPELTVEKAMDLKPTLKPKQEAYGVTHVKLDRVPASGALELKTSLKLGGEDLSFPYPLKTLEDTVGYEEHATFHPGAPVPLILQPKETLKEAKVVVASGFSGAILPSLKWLMGYPYGCVEQLVSSTVPNLFVQEMLEGEGVKPAKEPEKGFMDKMKGRFFRMVASIKASWSGKPKLTKDQEEMLRNAVEFSKSGLQRLRSYQNTDGSLSWFPGGGEANESMTALVLLTLSSMETPTALQTMDYRKAMGWLSDRGGSPGSSMGVTLSYIQSRVEYFGLTTSTPETRESNLKLSAEWAAEHGSVYDKALTVLAIQYSKMAGKAGMGPLVQNLLKQLKTHVEAEPSSPDSNDGWSPADWHGYPGRFTSVLAVASRALFEYGQLNPDLQKKVAKRLLKSFDGEHFGSTYETAQTLVHSGWLVKDELKRKNASSPPKLLVSGAPIAAAKLKAEPVIGGWEIKVAGDAVKGPLSVEGLTEDLTARVKFHKESAIDDAPTVAGAWDLKKEVYRMDERTGDVTPLEGRLKIGDLVYVKLSFKRNKRATRWWASNYYMLSDLVPAGLSVIEEDKLYEGAPFKLDLRSSNYRMRDIHDDKVRWYFAFERSWQDRAWQVGYVMRANFAGDFTGGVARMEDFYDETRFSQTASSRIGIDPFTDRSAGG